MPQTLKHTYIAKRISNPAGDFLVVYCVGVIEWKCKEGTRY